MPVRTVAEWGGVHEWTVDAAKALIRAGHEVIFVGQGDVFKARAQATGAKFIDVEWNSALKNVETIAANHHFDMVFSHAPDGRKLGIALSQITGVPHVVMVHGAFHDRMYEWGDEVDAIAAASPSLVHFAQRVGRVPPWKVSCIPNAAPNEVFDLPLRTMEQKLEGGVGVVLTASRLAKDKVQQISAVERSVEVLAREMPDIEWVIKVYGDGPLQQYYRNRYEAFSRTIPNVSYKMEGWIEPNEVPLEMNRSFLTVTAGMAGMRACASGTLCLGVGARNNVGIQIGQNLRAGIWSNFGDHGIPQFTPTSLESDLVRLSRSAEYDESVSIARETIWKGNRQELVDHKMLSVLQC